MRVDTQSGSEDNNALHQGVLILRSVPGVVALRSRRDGGLLPRLAVCGKRVGKLNYTFLSGRLVRDKHTALEILPISLKPNGDLTMIRRNVQRIHLLAFCAWTVLSLAAQEMRGQVRAGPAEFGWTLFLQVATADPTLARPDLRLIPQDFSVDDAPISIKLPFKLFINSKEYQGHAIGWHLDVGSTMWLALPGRGRYILSLVPRAGYDFSKTGSIRNHVIMFNAGGDEYEIRTSGPVAGSGKAWNLYVLHQSAWEPKGPLFGVERLDNLLRHE